MTLSLIWYLREVSRSFLVFRLLFREESSECDNVCVDFLRRGAVAVAVHLEGVFGCFGDVYSCWWRYCSVNNKQCDEEGPKVM
jgi:hypothetical protein